MYSRGYTPCSSANWRAPSKTRTGEARFRPVTSHTDEREIKDLSYYKGKVDVKMGELRAELYSMREEIKLRQAEDRLIAYSSQKARAVTKELTESQNLMSDLHTTLDKVNMKTTVGDLLRDTAELKKDNDAIEMEHEERYESRRKQEEMVSKMRAELMKIQRANADKNKLDSSRIHHEDYIGNADVRKSIMSHPGLSPKERQILLNDKRRQERAFLELQLAALDTKREALLQQSNLISEPQYGEMDIEEEVSKILDKLKTGVTDKLKNMKKLVEKFPNVEHYEELILKDISEFGEVTEMPRDLLIILRCHLLKVKRADGHLRKAIAQFTGKASDLRMLCSTLNLIGLENAMGRMKSDLTKEKTLVVCRRQALTEKLRDKEAELSNYEKQLMSNKEYGEMRRLEVKLSNLLGSNYTVMEYLEEGRALGDLEEFKERALSTVNRLNASFISSLNQ